MSSTQLTTVAPVPQKNYYAISVCLVLLGGIIWSFSNLIPRYMIAAEDYRWHFLFFRALGISGSLLIYQIVILKSNVFEKIYDIGWSGLIGGIALATAMTNYVFAITNTTIAVIMFMYALGPLITSILSRIILKERIKPVTWVAMIGSFLGCMILVVDQFKSGSSLGACFAFNATFMFAVYTVSIRWKAGVPKPRTTIIAGFFAAIFAFLYMQMQGTSLIAIPPVNVLYSFFQGSLTGTGLILFMLGARYLLSTELILLSLIEIVMSIILSVIPFFGVNETISGPTQVGGVIILSAIMLRTITLNEKNPFFQLKKKYKNL